MKTVKLNLLWDDEALAVNYKALVMEKGEEFTDECEHPDIFYVFEHDEKILGQHLDFKVLSYGEEQD
tara:strand:+ start:628 stop:828 length:201 start_codon:yes stop_codon:yes gene_type:complete